MNAHDKCGFLGFQNSSNQTNYNSAVNTSTNDSNSNITIFEVEIRGYGFAKSSKL